VTASATRATAIVERARVEHRIHVYTLPERHGRERGSRPAYGLEAATALGVPPERVFKTLVALVDDRLVLAVLPVGSELDLKRLADALNGRRAELAEPAVAERATGYVIGGISPLGSRRRLPVVLDTSATDQGTVFVSAGRRGLQLELGATALAELTSAIQAQIARDL
jgi:Cys-tRNA(Pro)/Cys-tRNA(Cys) deacylase